MPRTKQWVQTKLGSVATFTNGGAWNASEYVESGIPVVRVTDCQNGTVDVSACKYLPAAAFAKYRKHEIAEGDLIVATVGSHPTQPGSVVGRPIVVPREASGALLNQNAVCIRPTEYSILDKRFLSHFAKAPPFGEYVIACARGSANQVRMAIGLLKEMPIEIPLLLTQRKISAILSAYDVLIENNLRRIKILEEMAQNLYREWFVKFRFPGHQHAHFTDSPLGCIPEGWAVKRLGEILELNYGKALKQETRRGGDVPVYGSSGVVGYHDLPLVNGPGIVVGRKGNVGSVFWSDVDFYPIDTVYFVTSKMPLRFLFYELQTKNFLNNDAALPGLNRNQAYSLETLAPPADILAWFCQFADDFERQAGVLRLQNTTLRCTRDLLLPRLISGEVDVSDLDIVVPEEAVT